MSKPVARIITFIIALIVLSICSGGEMLGAVLISSVIIIIWMPWGDRT